jgi:plastocyanin
LPAARRPSEFQNVVVFLDSDTAEPSEPSRATVRQTREEFLPHLVAVTAGSTVDFPNDDLVFHNVFSLSRGATFDLGRYPKNASKSRTFMEPGIVKVFCHLHSHMSAIVRVFPHPHFAIPDEQGQFTLAGLPAGAHVIAAWHERVGIVRQEITVSDGGLSTATFSLPLMDEK